jgi:hypothetical protein
MQEHVFPGDFTILGLLGPAGSGKDLVADWFVTKGFVKISFADPMKRFVYRAFGIDEERLWGPSEKRNEMFDVSEAWWYEVIGHFGDAAQEIVQYVLLEGLKVDGYLRLHDWMTTLRKNYPNKISARVILQTLGTEWGRAIDPTMWSRYAYTTASKLSQVGTGMIRYRPQRGLYTLDEGSEKRAIGVIIPDHRFRNEVDSTHEIGGYVIRLCRPATERHHMKYGSDFDVGVAGHKSESEHKEIPDNILDAVYELPEGIDKVHAMLEDTYPEKPWARKWDRTNEYECNVVCYDPIPAPVV